MRRLGCSVGRVRVCCPLLLRGVLKFDALPALSHSFHDTLHKQPWRAALVDFDGSIHDFTSHLMALSIRLTLVIDFLQGCLLAVTVLLHQT